jgi:hypothetical protein
VPQAIASILACTCERTAQHTLPYGGWCVRALLAAFAARAGAAVRALARVPVPERGGRWGVRARAVPGAAGRRRACGGPGWRAGC